MKKRNKGLLGQLMEQQAAAEMRAKRAEEKSSALSSEMAALRAERKTADAELGQAISQTHQTAEGIAQKTAEVSDGIGKLKEGAATAADLEKAQKAGMAAVQMAVSAGVDMAESIAIFKKAYPEWLADGGTETVNHITYYPKTDMAYICIAEAQRIAVYAPDLATNNYCPYPEADENGVYPYVYGMQVWGGMKVRYEGTEYRCILADGSKYKLTYTPDQVPSVFTAEGGE